MNKLTLERELLILTDANYGNDLFIRADCIDAVTVVADTTYRDGKIPDGTWRRTLVYTRGGNCLTVRETPGDILKMMVKHND